jgi:hypothetical protein
VPSMWMNEFFPSLSVLSTHQGALGQRTENHAIVADHIVAPRREQPCGVPRSHTCQTAACMRTRGRGVPGRFRPPAGGPWLSRTDWTRHPLTGGGAQFFVGIS